MASGRVSSVELTEAAIARIERHDATINAVCVPDFERALAAARDADAARARGEVTPLLGVPMTVKESYHVAGLPTTWGFSAFADFVPDADAVAVARVKAAGAVVLGKTNVPVGLGDFQSYNDLYGTTRNPWNPDRIPGGSSGGSSAALAAGYGPLSLGSDIGGSLRNPAHYCGVYAHKPSLGLLTARGHTPPGVPAVPGESDLAVIGPMARTPGDLSLLLDILAEPDELSLGTAYRLALPPSRHTDLADFRVLVLDAHPLMPSSTSVRNAINDFATELANAGAKVTRDSPLLPDLSDAARLYMRLLISFLYANIPSEQYEAVREAAAGLDPDDRSLAAERTRGGALSHRDWVIADGRRAVLRQQWRELFAEFDVVLCPVMSTPAIPHDHSGMAERRITVDGTDYEYFDQLAMAGVATLPGLPATALPIGRSEENLPIGVQAIGPMYGDRTTLRFAELAEQLVGGFTPPPLD
ncbi:amidase [Pseudonocardia acaciae]|uniref:amidase n=1 Tax=Pseudonocardia acaciae TaxID=551276 RepID=UPI0006884CE2|nr:amidase [Pseudonocardia acaciae]